MALQFEKIRVKEVRRETPECVSILFDIPQHLKVQFEYKAGQYITLRAFIGGEEVRRSYSLCSSPLDNEWRIAVKKVEGGVFSSWANTQLKSGDILELLQPMGNFYIQPDPANHKHYIGMAAGSGITPVISIIKTVLLTEPNSSFTLVYGNRNRHSIIFKEELDGLKNKYMHRFNTVHIFSREMTDAAINHGRINAEKCAHLFEKALTITADDFFICGPEAMTLDIKQFLTERNVAETKIHVELFNTDIKTRQNPTIKPVAEETPKSKITIRHDGVSSMLELAFEEESILDAALYQGIDLPYSCKAGVCCTCRAKLLEGEAEMEVCYGLEPEEIEQGYILTCQSHPTSEKLVVDFDAK